MVQAAAASTPTLRDINQRLVRAGLPLIPPERLKEIVSPGIRDRFLRCVFLADQDTESLKFLHSTLKTAGLISTSAARHIPPEKSAPAANEPPAARAAPEQSPHSGRDDSSAEEQGWESFHAYGSKAALCFNVDLTKSGSPTIALDAASSIGSKAYDWKNKIRIQLTKAELPVVAAVLIGARVKCEFKNHGPNNDKGFSMERQDGGKIFISVFAKEHSAKAVPVFAPDVMWVTAMVLKQVQKNCPDIDSMGVITLVRVTQSDR
jgi:hypothetical protein